MRELHRLFGDRVQFVDLVVRQAHPGERHGGYRSYPEKLDDARRYQEEEGISWPVVVDGLDVQLCSARWEGCPPPSTWSTPRGASPSTVSGARRPR